uniref:Uncharacterized protein n=1 Tax=Anguilla anguilla TaxID=7936 RepID=A0A0E9QGB9_ANGAN
MCHTTFHIILQQRATERVLFSMVTRRRTADVRVCENTAVPGEITEK